MRYTVRPISDRTPFTGKHRRSAFDSTWTSTQQLLEREVKMLDGRDLVVECDVTESQIRIDGGLYANARPTSPAVRVAFTSKHGPLTYATDRFDSWQDNVRAIALSLEALRRVDRYGVSEHGEQYTGWKQLPAGTAMPASHMTHDEAWRVIDKALGFKLSADERADTNEARAAYHLARRRVHPDRNGGDRTAWDQVEAAAKVLGVLS
ncbi:hypothetical protein [Mumia sp. DW29H23]|uniref:hypothetical protein n=1 Tax=Mumia sp. DW29H23 TaxID=3421241 RepID=UPI003D690FA1